MGNEASDQGGSEETSRPPTLRDLSRLCAELNRLGARYIVVGGFAIIQAGYFRGTDDIDLLIETTLDNEARVIESLLILPDKAAAEIKPGEVGQYGVVRVGDEVLVDLMKSGCGVTYADAIKDAVFFEIDGVRVPFASAQTLWKMKQTVRAKDIPDRMYLQRLLQAQGINVEAVEPHLKNPLSDWWQRFKSRWRK